MAGRISGQRHDRTALIAYGSETGNSQDAAEHLGRVFERLRFVTKVAELDDVDIVRSWCICAETAMLILYFDRMTC